MRALDPEVVDVIWRAVEPLIPPRQVTHPLGCHRQRASDRACFAVMLVRLATGCSWEDAERLCGNEVSDTTVRDRRTEWIDAGVFDAVAAEAIGGYDRIIGLDLSDVAVDGCLHKAPAGGEGTGPNPTDRGKLGWKWSILTDRNGIPLGWTIDGANRNDSVLLAPTLDDAAGRVLLGEIDTLWLDRGYDSGVTRERLAERGIDDAIIAKKRQRRAGQRHRQRSNGSALARRAHELVAVELRSAPPKHRPANITPPRTIRPGGRRVAHRQAHRLAKPLVTDPNTYPLSLYDRMIGKDTAWPGRATGACRSCLRPRRFRAPLSTTVARGFRRSSGCRAPVIVHGTRSGCVGARSWPGPARADVPFSLMSAHADADLVKERPSGTVTFLFTDVEGSTRSWEQRCDADGCCVANFTIRDRSAVRVAGGYVFATGGDSFAVAFAAAGDAVAAAVDVQRGLAAAAWPTGRCVCGWGSIPASPSAAGTTSARR